MYREAIERIVDRLNETDAFHRAGLVTIDTTGEDPFTGEREGHEDEILGTKEGSEDAMLLPEDVDDGESMLVP